VDFDGADGGVAQLQKGRRTEPILANGSLAKPPYDQRDRWPPICPSLMSVQDDWAPFAAQLADHGYQVLT
jgi:hypothetical protein